MPVTMLIRAYEREYNGALALDTMTEARHEAHEYHPAHIFPNSEKRAQLRTFLHPLATRRAYP